MRKNIKIYIANKEVDFDEDLSLPLVYTVEDFNNPTIVKNTFSKTVTLPGTSTNNKIFGEIYKLDRVQGYNFNPLKRVDFQIFNNADLVESGYIQLTSIVRDNDNISYEVTFYGGLGDFFYNLKTDDEGNNKTLADLQYFIERDGEVLPKESEMDFVINKELVFSSFFEEPVENTLLDYIRFVPANNGLYDNFSSDKCLINTQDNIYPTNLEGYIPYKGYALASLNKEYTEWEIGDLRSYKQRPSIKLSKLIKTICRKENSGYEVEFDPKFFNKENPY